MTRRYITGIFATIHPIHPIHPIEPIEPIEPIHPIHTVSVQPFSVMTHWRVFQVRGPLGSRSRHLVGRAGGEGRVCTALTSLTAVSGSGRFYRLEGQPGQDPDATYVWEQWTRLNWTRHMLEITRALFRLRSLRGIHDL